MESCASEFQILAKPAGANCNLRCSYCYYINNAKNPGRTGSELMSDVVLEQFIKQNIEATTADVVRFAWHGGEPLTAGIGFFQKALKYQTEFNLQGKQILNGIQTNGTLINSEWARFLANERFFVGLSLDGPAVFHNAFRHTSGGVGSFEMAVKGLKTLERHRVPVEILCVVNSKNAGFPLEVYNFFKSLDTRFITFLPLVEQDPLSPSGVTQASITPGEFGDFLSTIFDEWKQRDIGNLKVQIFEEVLRTAFGQEHTLCIFKKNCGGVPVLEHDGSFYSCDHFVDKDHLLGNISDDSITHFLDSQMQKLFGNAKRDKLPAMCLECPVLNMCNGECPKNRFIRTPEGDEGLNYLCEGYRNFFSHCKPFTDAVASAWRLSLQSGS
jgi:uncharacterized protein